jgi:hypothetical protein
MKQVTVFSYGRTGFRTLLRLPDRLGSVSCGGAVEQNTLLELGLVSGITAAGGS